MTAYAEDHIRVGDTVRLTLYGLLQVYGYPGEPLHDRWAKRTGVVVREQRDPLYVMVRWEGRKTPVAWPRELLRHAR